jgi:hypothetical protein
MKVLVAISIYDRKENLEKWLHAWKYCKIMDSELLIVHNDNGEDWSEECKKAGVQYIKRPNIGFETGIIQDIFLNKLAINNNWWEVLIFVTDDTLPMSNNFIPQYVEEVKKSDVGAVCMEISGVYSPHIRTTGFAIRRDVANKIKWAWVPVDNKGQCYHFEHQGGELTMYSQLLLMGYRVVQPDIPRNSVFWDTHHNLHFDRWNEWHKEFPGFY